MKHQFKKVIVMVYSLSVNIGVGRVSAGMDDATSSLVGSRVVIIYWLDMLFAEYHLW